MASLIFLKDLFPEQRIIRCKGTVWNFEEDITGPNTNQEQSYAIIAKGNIIEGIEAKE